MSVQRAAPERTRGNAAEMAIAQLAQADRALSEAIRAADAVNLVHTAKALNEWASAVRAGRDHEKRAAVFVLRAVRNAGERIEQAQERGEVARPGLPPSQRDISDGDIPATLADIGVTPNESSEWKRLAEEYPTDEALVEAAETMERPSLAGAHRLAALMTSDSPEWYTPPEVVAAVVAAMGGIDLDPCADPGKAIPAAVHFTAEDDGLQHVWLGRVYMNPPYGREIGDWIDKLVLEYGEGNVTEAIALVPGRIDTSWYRRIARVAVHVSGRLRFSGADPAPFPSVALYLGPNEDAFSVAFSHLGDVWRRAA